MLIFFVILICNPNPGLVFCPNFRESERDFFLCCWAFKGLGIISRFRLYPQSSACSTAENIILISQVKVINVTNLLNVSSIIFRVGNLLFMYNVQLFLLPHFFGLHPHSNISFLLALQHKTRLKYLIPTRRLKGMNEAKNYEYKLSCHGLARGV